MNWYSKLAGIKSHQKVVIAQATSLVDEIDLSSFESFINSLKKLSKPDLNELQLEMDRVRSLSFMPATGWKKLYHGTSGHIADSIKSNGFSLGQGRRSGFLGMTEYVENQGIFLSDAPESARYFGKNRSDDPRDAQLVSCYADVSRVMSYENAPREVVRLGLSIVNKENGTRKTRLAVRDWWWLLDQPEFVSLIKRSGFSGVTFQEDPRMALPGRTYLIFDPSSIKVVGKKGDGINTVADFYEYLKFNNPTRSLAGPEIAGTSSPFSEHVAGGLA